LSKIILPEILVPKYRDIQLDAPPVGIAGFMKWELQRDGKVIQDSGGFYPNLITDVGMNALASSTISAMVANANCGTSAAAPAFTDAALGAEVATAVVGRTTVLNATYNAVPEYWFLRNKYTFLETQANGNLAEFGLFSAAHTLFVRQLLKDGVGNPVVITKTNLDQLIITHEYRVYPPTADVASVVVISGVNYDVVTRPCNSNSVFAWGQVGTFGWAQYSAPAAVESNVLVTRTGSPAGGAVSGDGTQTAYVPGTFMLENKAVWEPADAVYTTGIGMINSWSGDPTAGSSPARLMFQNQFIPQIPKLNTQRLTLFGRRSWARYP
jgi:hypothetical protein